MNSQSPDTQLVFRRYALYNIRVATLRYQMYVMILIT